MRVGLDRGGVGLERDEKSEVMKIECGVKVCEWTRIGIGVAEDSEGVCRRRHGAGWYVQELCRRTTPIRTDLRRRRWRRDADGRGLEAGAGRVM